MEIENYDPYVLAGLRCVLFLKGQMVKIRGGNLNPLTYKWVDSLPFLKNNK